MRCHCFLLVNFFWWLIPIVFSWTSCCLDSVYSKLLTSRLTNVRGIRRRTDLHASLRLCFIHLLDSNSLIIYGPKCPATGAVLVMSRNRKLWLPSLECQLEILENSLAKDQTVSDHWKCLCSLQQVQVSAANQRRSIHTGKRKLPRLHLSLNHSLHI